MQTQLAAAATGYPITKIVFGLHRLTPNLAASCDCARNRFVCLFVCLLVCLFVCLFVCWFVCLTLKLQQVRLRKKTTAQQLRNDCNLRPPSNVSNAFLSTGKAARVAATSLSVSRTMARSVKPKEKAAANILRYYTYIYIYT
jgi:hypothetical protein